MFHKRQHTSLTRYCSANSRFGPTSICRSWTCTLNIWGLDTPQYKMSMYKKKMLYQQEEKRLVSVFPKDLPALDALLSSKLKRYGFVV